MKLLTCIGLAALVELGGAVMVVPAQDQTLRVLDVEETRRFLPDRVPMEANLIPVDPNRSAALQFPDKARFAVAALSTVGLDAAARNRYQYVFVSEAKLRLDRWSIPAGMVGVAIEPPSEPNAPRCQMVTRDFSGTELDRVILTLNPTGKEGSLELIPKGGTEFELRIGKYVIQGAQK